MAIHNEVMTREVHEGLWTMKRKRHHKQQEESLVNNECVNNALLNSAGIYPLAIVAHLRDDFLNSLSISMFASSDLFYKQQPEFCFQNVNLIIFLCLQPSSGTQLL